MKTCKQRIFSRMAFLAILAIAFISCPEADSDSNHIHEWGEWTVTIPADCTTAGVETSVCTDVMNPDLLKSIEGKKRELDFFRINLFKCLKQQK